MRNDRRAGSVEFCKQIENVIGEYLVRRAGAACRALSRAEQIGAAEYQTIPVEIMGGYEAVEALVPITLGVVKALIKEECTALGMRCMIEVRDGRIWWDCDLLHSPWGGRDWSLVDLCEEVALAGRAFAG
jgi:hypothetical protein